MKWMDAFESKDWKVNHGKTNVMVSCGTMNDGLSKGNGDPYGI